MVISWQFQFLYNWLRMGNNDAKLVIDLGGNDAESCHIHRKHNPFVTAAAAAAAMPEEH